MTEFEHINILDRNLFSCQLTDVYSRIGPESPEQTRRITGEESQINDHIEKFFETVLDFVGFKQRAREAFCTREAFELQRNGVVSDDVLELLIARDILVASVLKRRSEYNMVEASFAQYLNPETLDWLRSNSNLLE